MAAFVTELFRRRRLLANWRPDAVIASSTYTWDNYPARIIAKACAARFVYEVHDLWPLSPMEISGMSRLHPFILSLQHAEDFACRHADAVVSLLPFANRHLESRGMSPGRFHYVPNGIELDEWQECQAPLPDCHSSAIRDLRARCRLLILYAGAHGPSNALDTLLGAAELLRGRPIGFLMVGDGSEKSRLQSEVARMQLGNVLMLPSVGKRAIPALLREADVLYVGHVRTPLHRFGISPNKLMDYMAAERPVIQAIDAGNDIVAEASCGVSITPGDSAASARAILEMSEMSVERRAEMAERGRRYVRQHHDYKVLAARFVEIIESARPQAMP
jgi:glycosyltransferase involved in cell wall biosynthesis